jgi:hypothetical protein
MAENLDTLNTTVSLPVRATPLAAYSSKWLVLNPNPSGWVYPILDTQAKPGAVVRHPLDRYRKLHLAQGVKVQPMWTYVLPRWGSALR